MNMFKNTANQSLTLRSINTFKVQDDVDQKTQEKLIYKRHELILLSIVLLLGRVSAIIVAVGIVLFLLRMLWELFHSMFIIGL